jgi:AmiR/NasT family two-component response regulator
MEWIGALANSAALSFRTGRSEAQARELGDQLQRGLIGRTLVNDAKRLLAAEMKMGDDEALELLRHYSRSHSRSIVEVAADTVERRISLNELTEEPGHPEFRRS